MKRAGLNCGAFILIIAVVLFGLPLLTRNQTTQAAAAIDYLNPLVPCQTVYVSTQTDQVEWLPNAHGGRDYRYELTAYAGHTQPRHLQLQVSDRPLARNAILAVKAKGQKVLRWHRVAKRAVPQTVRQQLKAAGGRP